MHKLKMQKNISRSQSKQLFPNDFIELKSQRIRNWSSEITLWMRPSSMIELLNFLNNSYNASISLTVTATKQNQTKPQCHEFTQFQNERCENWKRKKKLRNEHGEFLARVRKSWKEQEILLLLLLWSLLVPRWKSKQPANPKNKASTIPINGMQTAQSASPIVKLDVWVKPDSKSLLEKQKWRSRKKDKNWITRDNESSGKSISLSL